MSDASETSKPKTSPFQFSMRTLMLVMVAVMVASTGVRWYLSRAEQARENRERVAGVEKTKAAIEKLGGHVQSYYEVRRDPTWLEREFDDPGTADDPVGVTIVEFVSFVENGLATDAALKQLKGLTNPKGLELNDSNVTDAGLANIEDLTSLERLSLAFTGITDAGLVHLKGLTHLRSLELVACRSVTDTGLKHLEGLENLQYLDLRGTKITDAGLEHLSGLRRLESLRISPKVVGEGVEKLRKALPNCAIVSKY